MDDMNLEYEFGQGFVQNRHICRVISKFDEFATRGSASSSLMMWSEKKSQWFHYTLGWTAVRLACSSSHMFALGADGQLLIAGAQGMREETITPPGGSTDSITPFTDLRIIGEQLFAVGKGPVVLERSAEKDWQLRDEGLEPGVALNAIDGLAPSELYAVGESGAIWQCAGTQWSACDSPVSVSLRAVHAVDPQLTFAAGEDGVLLKGMKGKWEVVAREPNGRALLSLQWFKDKLYAATVNGVLVLTDDGLENAPFAPGVHWTSGHLHAADGVMWSFGQKHLFRTEDGETFAQTTPSFTVFDPSDTGPPPTQSTSSCCQAPGGHGHTSGGRRCD